MNVAGYKINVINCAKTFLKQHNSYNFHNRPATYIVKLNDRIKIGHCNNFYNRLQTYNSMFKNVEVLHARGFPSDTTKKYNVLFAERLARINNHSFHHDATKEITILKTVKDLVSGKHKIMDLDY